MACALIAAMVFTREKCFFSSTTLKLSCYLMCGAGTYSILSCRSHYTVDVILGSYFAFALVEFYYHRLDSPFVRYERAKRAQKKVEVAPNDHLRQKRASEGVVGGRPPDPPLLPERLGCTCARSPHMRSAAHALGRRTCARSHMPPHFPPLPAGLQSPPLD
jgi:hypothetical protein